MSWLPTRSSDPRLRMRYARLAARECCPDTAQFDPARHSRRLPTLSALAGMIEGTVDSTLDSGRWLSPLDAARALGVSK